MEKKGFVAIFGQELDRARVSECVDSWLERFEKVEQVAPATEFTLEVKETKDILWDANLQFRVSQRRSIRLDLCHAGHARPWKPLASPTRKSRSALEVLLELPEVTEIVDEKNQRRLEELEKAGVI